MHAQPETILFWIMTAGVAVFIVLLICTNTIQYPAAADDYDQAFPYPPLGNYGPDNRDLPDVSQGWHIFADGNMWCAVGPAFLDLQASPAGFGYNYAEAYRNLCYETGKDAARRGLSTDEALAIKPPGLACFAIHEPTVKNNAS